MKKEPIDLVIISTIDPKSKETILKIGDLRKEVIDSDTKELVALKLAEITINKNCSGNRHFDIGLYYTPRHDGTKIMKRYGKISSMKLLNTILKEFYI